MCWWSIRTFREAENKKFTHTGHFYDIFCYSLVFFVAHEAPCHVLCRWNKHTQQSELIRIEFIFRSRFGGCEIQRMFVFFSRLLLVSGPLMKPLVYHQQPGEKNEAQLMTTTSEWMQVNTRQMVLFIYLVQFLSLRVLDIAPFLWNRLWRRLRDLNAYSNRCKLIQDA